MSRQLEDVNERLKDMGFEQLGYPNMTASVELLDTLLDHITIYRDSYEPLTNDLLNSYFGGYDEIDELVAENKELKFEIEQLKAVEDIAETFIKMYENKCKEVDKLKLEK